MTPFEKLVTALERNENWRRLLDRMHNTGEINTAEHAEYEVYLENREHSRTVYTKVPS